MHCHNSLLSPALKFRSVDYYVWAGYNFVSVLLSDVGCFIQHGFIRII